MGIMRLILAMSVAYSHTPHGTIIFNTGVFAVIGFFLISGFVMTGLWTRYYGQFFSVPSFYADRLLRIYPQYLFYLCAFIVFIAITGGVGQETGTLSLYNLALNALIVPNNYIWLTLPRSLYLRPTWSLGLELTFYIVFPLIIVARARLAFLFFSAVFFLVPYAGFLNTDLWGYRFLPGTLFMFLTGSYLFSDKDQRVSPIAGATWLYAAILLSCTWIWSNLHVLYNREVLCGLIVGIPAVWMLRFQRSSRLDRIAGNLSYGVFLNHIVLIWAMRLAGVSFFGFAQMCILATASMVLAAITYHWVERPLLGWRHRWFRRSSNSVASTATTRF